MHRPFAAWAVVCLAATTARAQTQPDLSTLTLEELSTLKVEVVSSASKFAQEVTHAPASISIVTAEEMRRLGHRTLKDVLDSVRGLYTSDDRNYSYVGVRGFARPGDYNTRMLLLIDGHRINDPVYDQARIGEDMLVDIESIDRVEIIRGPGSSLYGTNAFFGVVNIITRTGRQQDGVRVDVDRASLDMWRGRASVGHRFDNGADLYLAGSVQRADGYAALYYPEFDTAQTNFGTARNLDGEEAQRLFGAFSIGNFTLRGAYGDRAKQVPTGAYDTIFGDPRFETRDTQSFLDASYGRALGRGWTGLARLEYNRYTYTGGYPTPGPDETPLFFQDSTHVDWLTGELTMNRRLSTRHLLTLGMESRQALRQSQLYFDQFEVHLDDSTRTSSWGAYVQDEFRVLPKLLINGGARFDHFGSFGSEIAPRIALIYHPVHGTGFKLLHGRAFRAPNAYEHYYYAAQAAAAELQPETITTTEGIWEQYVGHHLRSSVSMFQSNLSNLITQSSVDGSDSDLYFANMNRARARGVEGELEGRWSGALARVSHAFVTTRDADTGLTLTNAPRNVTKLSIIVPLARQASIGVEGQFLGERFTLDRETLPATFLANLRVVSGHWLPYAQFSLSVHNVFDRAYQMPGAEEHRQQALPQNGRTLRAGLTWEF
jgi:iron complex outermembrane receptor protein